MDLKNFESEISKTGFVLENKIARLLKSNGWTVISNRYYVDDHQESVREIDIVGYRVAKVQHFDVCTTLLISCKKSESNIWALLARTIDKNDPNTDWWPLHTWTNDKALQYEISNIGFAKRYHEEMILDGLVEPLRFPEVDVFAFQEMNKVKGTPKNDSPIFNSITSLMKAQAYEQTALPNRKKTPAIYQFNLISIIDSGLVRLKFENDNIAASSIESEHYIARYIVQKKETFSRIRFILADKFDTYIKEYESLHRKNCVYFNNLCNEFFAKSIKETKRTQVFIDIFRKRVSWFLSWQIKKNLNITVELDDLNISWRNDENIAVIAGPYTEEGEKLLNNDKLSRQKVSDALKELYRYEGKFIFSEDEYIPF
ncbi:MAG: hypothetical protein A2W76_03445 [Gammaproteobacteria bacterium RIFCSPLOWO2_12_47_11]|nr:MAG: hypothetical protein A2W76_03445 [Gammaproteobacteria bacterium RIFCSPLOWO2_12_47_11]